METFVSTTKMESTYFGKVTLNNSQIHKYFAIIKAWQKAPFYVTYFTLLHRNTEYQIRQYFILISLIHLFWTLHLILLYFTQENVSPLVNLAQFNLIFIIGFHPLGNALFAQFVLLSLAVFRLLYLEPSGPTSKCLESILINGKSNFLAMKTFRIRAAGVEEMRQFCEN